MAKKTDAPQQYVVLPTRGLRAVAATSGTLLAPFLVGLAAVRTLATAKSFVAAVGLKMKAAFKVLHSMHEDGAKLLEMTPDAAQDLQASQPGLRVVPVVYYRPARARFEIELTPRAAAAKAAKVAAAAKAAAAKAARAVKAAQTVVTVTSDADGKPVRGATVVAFTDFAHRVGAQGTTSAQGVVKLALGGGTIEQLYIYPKKDFWGALRKNVSTRGGVAVALTPVALDYTDALRHYYGNAPDGAGASVKVGVVDTGVGPHPDLVVAGGMNCVTGEDDPNDFGDNGEGHGTHVGGIIAARGTPPKGIRGLAPAVTLRSYRVFGKGAEGASSYDIARAIDQATTDGCDLINLSLGGGPSDPATVSAIHDARQQGCVVVAAAGNDYRGPVSFPGADPLCVVISALGRKGTFPAGSVDEGDVTAPYGTVDAAEYIAAFSNVGPEINLTGTGVGILSTVPGGYAPMSGTSMATPAVVGFAARLLAQLPEVLAMPRNQDRSDAAARALLQSGKDRSFPANLQGNGMPLTV